MKTPLKKVVIFTVVIIALNLLFLMYYEFPTSFIVSEFIFWIAMFVLGVTIGNILTTERYLNLFDEFREKLPDERKECNK